MLAANVGVVLVLFVLCSFETLQVLDGTTSVVQRVISLGFKGFLEVGVRPVVFKDLVHLRRCLAALLSVWQSLLTIDAVNVRRTERQLALFQPSRQQRIPTPHRGRSAPTRVEVLLEVAVGQGQVEHLQYLV